MEDLHNYVKHEDLDHWLSCLMWDHNYVSKKPPPVKVPGESSPAHIHALRSKRQTMLEHDQYLTNVKWSHEEIRFIMFKGAHTSHYSNSFWRECAKNLNAIFQNTRSGASCRSQYMRTKKAVHEGASCRSQYMRTKKAAHEGTGGRKRVGSNRRKKASPRKIPQHSQPRGIRAEHSTDVNGGVKVNSPNGGVKVKSPNRGVKVKSPKGGVKVKSPNGGVKVKSPNGGVKVESPTAS